MAFEALLQHGDVSSINVFRGYLTLGNPPDLESGGQGGTTIHKKTQHLFKCKMLLDRTPLNETTSQSITTWLGPCNM